MQLATDKTGRPGKTQATIQFPFRSYAWFEARGSETARTVRLISAAPISDGQSW